MSLPQVRKRHCAWYRQFSKSCFCIKHKLTDDDDDLLSPRQDTGTLGEGAAGNGRGGRPTGGSLGAKWRAGSGQTGVWLSVSLVVYKQNSRLCGAEAPGRQPNPPPGVPRKPSAGIVTGADTSERAAQKGLLFSIVGNTDRIGLAL